MHTFAAAGASFLLAVLWFDLMFDVQVLRFRQGLVADDVLASIAAYYRRVTTGAAPMSRLVAAFMLLTIGALVGEIVEGKNAVWLEAVSLAAALAATGLAATRTVRDAVTLGRGDGTPEERSALARRICRDHLFCFAAIALVLVLQLCAR